MAWGSLVHDRDWADNQVTTRGERVEGVGREGGLAGGGSKMSLMAWGSLVHDRDWADNQVGREGGGRGERQRGALGRGKRGEEGD